jgi:hypothetical protein
VSEDESCGAEYPLRPGQEPCSKPAGHEHGPATDWKRDLHSNGLLKWQVDHSDMHGRDIPQAAAAHALLRHFGITGSQRRDFADRLEEGASVLAAIRHADRVLAAEQPERSDRA